MLTESYCKFTENGLCCLLDVLTLEQLADALEIICTGKYLNSSDKVTLKSHKSTNFPCPAEWLKGGSRKGKNGQSQIVRDRP